MVKSYLDELYVLRFVTDRVIVIRRALGPALPLEDVSLTKQLLF